ncbi:MAG: hypothetical protein Q4B96_01330 [Bacillota bacterium]|nr:hypothetical protein [Bacillota bacterium]
MLKLLFQLQSIEAAERAVHNEKKNSAEYQRLCALKADFEREKHEWQELNEQIAQIEQALFAYPALIKELREKCEAEKQAIYDGSINSTKELDARQSQAAAHEQKLAEAEQEAAGLGEKKAALDARQAELKQQMEGVYQQFMQTKEQFQQRQAQWQAHERKLAEQKAALVKDIDPDSLSWFEQNRDKFHGSPVARLDAKHVCSGCRTIVPPVTYKRTVLGQKTFCEKCSRILFVDGD